MAATLVADPPAPTDASDISDLPRHYPKLPEFLKGLGGVPLDRVVMNPLPGEATEQDCLTYGERIAPAELIDDTIVEKSMGYREGQIAMRLVVKLGTHIEQASFGGILNGPDAQMRVQSGNVRLPDVSWASDDRAPITNVPIPDLSPDLIVEVLSAGNTKPEIDRKLGEFFDGGTRLAWVVDRRERRVTVYRGSVDRHEVLDAAASLDGEDVLPGFSLPIASLFDGIPTGD
jgi:Uma2 family endonuclease